MQREAVHSSQRGTHKAGGNCVIADTVRVTRERLGWSRRELARRAGCSHSRINAVEAREHSLRGDLLTRIAQVFAAAGEPVLLEEVLRCADPVVLELNLHLQRPDISPARKRAVRRLVMSMIRLE